MREIKFRAWDKKKKVMFAVHELKFDKHDLSLDFIQGYTGYDRDGWTVEGNGIMRYANAPRYDLMQYTGLKDKNGKEIYEGDIVRISNHPFDGPIEVNRNYAVSYNSEMELCCGSWLLFRMRHYAEVIGNVFEHPELLKVKEGD
ncbi:YopX protein [compost metagenome]